MTKTIECPFCEGTGRVEYMKMSGYYGNEIDPITYEDDCEDCQGSGQVEVEIDDEVECDRCHSIFPEDETHTDDAGTWCEDCYNATAQESLEAVGGAKLMKALVAYDRDQLAGPDEPDEDEELDIQCAHCQAWTFPSESHQHHNGLWCQTCHDRNPTDEVWTAADEAALERYRAEAEAEDRAEAVAESLAASDIIETFQAIRDSQREGLVTDASL